MIKCPCTAFLLKLKKLKHSRTLIQFVSLIMDLSIKKHMLSIKESMTSFQKYSYVTETEFDILQKHLKYLKVHYGLSKNTGNTKTAWAWMPKKKFQRILRWFQHMLLEYPTNKQKNNIKYHKPPKTND